MFIIRYANVTEELLLGAHILLSTEMMEFVELFTYRWQYSVVSQFVLNFSIISMHLRIRASKFIIIFTRIVRATRNNHLLSPYAPDIERGLKNKFINALKVFVSYRICGKMVLREGKML